MQQCSQAMVYNGHLGAKGACVIKRTCFVLATNGTNYCHWMVQQPLHAQVYAAWLRSDCPEGLLGSINAHQQYGTVHGYVCVCIKSSTEGSHGCSLLSHCHAVLCRAVALQVDLWLGDACSKLPEVAGVKGCGIDLLLLDGLPKETLAYLKAAEPHLTPGAVVIADNAGG